MKLLKSLREIVAVQPERRDMLREYGIGIALAALALLVLFWCAWSVRGPAAVAPGVTPTVRPTARPTPRPSPTAAVVRYIVSGTAARADVTYANATGDTEQQGSVPLEWEYHFDAPPGQFVYVSAQSTVNAVRTVRCTIWVNGRVFKQAESSGRYVIATCSGTVPR